MTANRIDARFAALRRRGGKALVVYATSGDPRPGRSSDVFRAAVAGGADLVEIGVPFSDPSADGEAIQAASERALRHGGGLASAIADARALRRDDPAVGCLLFGYANPFFQAAGDHAAGTGRSARREATADAFAARLAASGVDGLLCVDLPPEEDDRLGPSLRRRGLHSIRLLAPTSTDHRLRRASASGGGFLYCVAVTGVTGRQGGDPAALRTLVRRARRFTRLPIVVGFGISTPDDAATMAAIADGVVVGSAVVRRVAEHGRRAPRHVERFVRAIRRAID